MSPQRADDLIGVPVQLEGSVRPGYARVHPGHCDPGAGIIELYEALLPWLRHKFSHQLPRDDEIAVGRDWDFHGGRVAPALGNCKCRKGQYRAKRWLRRGPRASWVVHT